MNLGTSASWLEWRMERGESVDTMFNYSPPKHPISACRRTVLHCGNCLSKRQRGLLGSPQQDYQGYRCGYVDPGTEVPAFPEPGHSHHAFMLQRH